jgi:hypothetical protein
MNDWELAEELQLRQQRFEAALKFIQIKMEHGDREQKVGDAVSEAIELADLLIAKLEEPTRQRPSADVPF